MTSSPLNAPMRFFTKAWHSGDMSDERADDVRAAYQSHLASILPELPNAFRSFVQTVSIHDALVRAVRLNRDAAVLELELRAGDQQAGYFDLCIRYCGVQLDVDSRVLAKIAEDDEFEALYDEADLAAGAGYEHRWLWWPYQEVNIRFTEFEYAVTPSPSRSFDRVANPFVEIVAHAG
jgi:hypothetical protein